MGCKLGLCPDFPPLSPPGLQVMAIAFALEVSVGKTNTVMALNSSNVLLPCTFTTCIGFQDLVFTWYFNSTELVSALWALPVLLAAPFDFSYCSSQRLPSHLLQNSHPSEHLQLQRDGAVPAGGFPGMSVPLA